MFGRRAFPGALVLLALAGLTSHPAGARDDLSGSWKEDYNEVVYAVEQWGGHCGEAPRSTGRASRGLTFTIEDRGVDLQFKSAEGSFSSSGCQSINPEVKPKERTLKDELFLITCATAEDSNAYESGLYSFRVLSSSQIEYRETTRFSRNLPGGLCVHTRRVRRMYSRQAASATPGPTSAADAGSITPPEPVKPPQPDQVPPVPPEDPCKQPGPAVALRLDPATATLAAGEQVCPKGLLLDAKGCAIPGPGALRLDRPPVGVRWTRDGCLQVGEKTRPNRFKLTLVSGKLKTAFELVVIRAGAGAPKPPTLDAGVLPRPLQRDAGAPEDPDAGPVEIPDQAPQEPAAADPDAGPAAPADSTAAAVPASTDAGSAAADAQAESRAAEDLPPWLLPAGLGAAGLILVVILFLVFARRRRPAAAPPAIPVPEPERPEPDRLATGPTLDAAATKPEPLRPAPAQTAFCITCGKVIPAEAKFCPFDRTPIHRPDSPTLPSAPVCPTCKRLLPPGAKFCPFDRTKLGN
jgi:hypothetical protein